MVWGFSVDWPNVIIMIRNQIGNRIIIAMFAAISEYDLKKIYLDVYKSSFGKWVNTVCVV